MANDKKAVVAIAKEPTVQESVTKVFDLLGGVTNMIKRGETVILKPNAGHAEGPDTAVCTSPETLRAVIREVKKAQPSRIIVAESLEQLLAVTSADDVRTGITKQLLDCLCQIADGGSIRLLDEQITRICMLESE